MRKSGNNDDFENLWSTHIVPYLWEIKVKESLRVVENADQFSHLAALFRRQEFKKLLECSDAELKNALKIMLKTDIYNNYIDEEIMLSDDFINNVLNDIKCWLSYEIEYQACSVLNQTNTAFVFRLASKSILDVLAQNNAPDAVQTNNNEKLKRELFEAIKEQRERAFKIIREKVINEQEKIKNLVSFCFTQQD